MQLGGKNLGRDRAALMGAMFGPTGAVPGILVGLIILAFRYKPAMWPMFTNSLQLFIKGKLFCDPASVL